VSVTENSTSFGDVLFQQGKNNMSAFVFDNVNDHNLGFAAKHSKHPPDGNESASGAKALHRIHFTLINLNRSRQHQIWSDHFFYVVAVSFPEDLEVLVHGLYYFLGLFVNHPGSG
jgi:hypothetical protein